MNRKYWLLVGFIAWILGLLIMTMVMSGCSDRARANKFLRHAKKDIRKAELLGAKVSSYTAWKDLVIISPEIKFNTTLQPLVINGIYLRPLSQDTLTATDKKTGAKVKAKIEQAKNCPDSCNRIMTVYLEGDCPEQKQTVKAPYSVSQKLETGHGFWTDVQIGGACFIVGSILTFIFGTMAKAWIRSLLGRI